MIKQLLLAGVFLLGSASLLADEVRIPVGEQGTQMDKPHTGMTKAQVQDKYGEPQERSQPVGDPPISYWEYPNFTVYFEYDRVIHAVSKYKSDTPLQEN